MPRPVMQAEWKYLPKYMHGEFKTLARSLESLERIKQRMEALAEKEIDTSEYYVKDPANKYYQRWIDRAMSGGMFVQGEKYLFAYAFQSCWPEESSNMIFQYLYEILKVRFKWWGKADWDFGDIHLVNNKAQTSKNALPNINNLFYRCPGDYAEKFHAGSRINKMNELYNYVSSPNLRENSTVTEIYSAVARAFQYCLLEIKRGSEIEHTTIADLWIELLETVEYDEAADIRDKQCHHCAENSDYVPLEILGPDGVGCMTTYLKLMNMFSNDTEKVKMAKDTFNRDTLNHMCRDIGKASCCQACVFNHIDLEEAQKVRAMVGEEFELIYPMATWEPKETTVTIPEEAMLDPGVDVDGDPIDWNAEITDDYEEDDWDEDDDY